MTPEACCCSNSSRAHPAEVLGRGESLPSSLPRDPSSGEWWTQGLEVMVYGHFGLLWAPGSLNRAGKAVMSFSKLQSPLSGSPAARQSKGVKSESQSYLHFKRLSQTCLSKHFIDKLPHLPNNPEAYTGPFASRTF